MRFTREQLQLLSDVLWAHQDEGPRGAGWASDPVSKLRAAVDVALAEPEPEGPTLAEVDDLCAEHSFHYEDDESLECLLLIITDALARWGRPAPEPVPVSERLPGPEDCMANPRNGEGEWCWGWGQYSSSTPFTGRWRMLPRAYIVEESTHWLPAHALPLPQPH